jgi:hypothetical protein
MSRKSLRQIVWGFCFVCLEGRGQEAEGKILLIEALTVTVCLNTDLNNNRYR